MTRCPVERAATKPNKNSAGAGTLGQLGAVSDPFDSALGRVR